MFKTGVIALFILFINISIVKSQHWVSLLNGFNYSPSCIYEDTTENVLYFGGWGSTTIENVAKWDGQTFSPVAGSSTLYQVNTIIRYKGDLYAGGYFPWYGKIKYIARFNGNTWDSLPTGVNGDVLNFKIINDELYVMGTFTKAGNIPAYGLAKWDGNQWSDVYSFPNLGSYYIVDIAMYKGELYVGGNFYIYGTPIEDIVKYNGSTWVDVGGGMHGGMSGLMRMVVYKNELYVAGAFYLQDGNAGNFIQRWDGTNWKGVGGGTLGYNHTISDNGQIDDMKVYNDELYIGGVFEYAGGVPAQHIAKWNGTEWCGLGSNFDNNIQMLEFYKDTLYIGGGFKKIDNDSINHVAKWIGGNYVDTCGVDNSGIEKTELQEMNISIYPNPANTFVNLQIELKEKEDFVINIYNCFGEKVFEETERNITGNFTKQINVSNLDAGIYIVNISINGKLYNKKIIKL